MKKMQLLFIGMLALGCQDDDRVYIPSYTPTTENFEGAWELRNVSGGIAGIYDDFSAGEIRWIINEQDQTVTVFNNNPEDGEVDFFESGIYDYQIVINPATPEICGFNLEIDGINLGCFTISESEFKLSMIESDGYVLTLRRPEMTPR